MIRTQKILLVLVAICMFFLTSCSKKETIEVDNETQSIVDYAIADQEFASLITGVYHGAMVTHGTGAHTHTYSINCDTLAHISGPRRDTTNFSPNPVYLFNPSESCSKAMNDGKIRTGSVSVRLTGSVRKPGSQIILKLNNYRAAQITYSCDSIILTTKESNLTYVSFHVVLVNGKTATSAYNIQYRFNRTYIIYPRGGSGTSEMVTHIYGEASGTNRQGINFSTNVYQENYLVKRKNCPYFDKGRMDLTPQGFKLRHVDFGDGNCDDEATFTVNENTVAFKLK